MHHRPGQINGPRWSQHARRPSRLDQAVDGNETKRATGSLVSLVATSSESGLGPEQPVEEPLDG